MFRSKRLRQCSPTSELASLTIPTIRLRRNGSSCWVSARIFESLSWFIVTGDLEARFALFPPGRRHERRGGFTHRYAHETTVWLQFIEEESLRCEAQEAGDDSAGRGVDFLLQIDVRGNWHSVSELDQSLSEGMRSIR